MTAQGPDARNAPLPPGLERLRFMRESIEASQDGEEARQLVVGLLGDVSAIAEVVEAMIASPVQVRAAILAIRRRGLIKEVDALLGMVESGVRDAASDADNGPPGDRPDGLIGDGDVALWLGNQAARRGCVPAGRSLIASVMLKAYADGAALPESAVVRVRLTDVRRRALIRRLEAVAKAAGAEPPRERQAPPLAVRIVRLVQRADVGTATRYDLTLGADDRETLLQDLRAADLLTWHRLRPIACDARLVLPTLGKGQASLWHEEVSRAMREAERVDLCDEESDAMEIRGILRDLTTSARLWTWSEEDPYPRGVARIEYPGAVGWPRGPLLREVRSQMGRVSRVALRRARVHLGWVPRDWRIETAYLRVWATQETT